jgi:uncharacterized membrane protein YgdD (TMEM256/DUF423 family)
MTRLLATSGALFGLIAVAFGAFGAHALEGRITADRAEVWTTAAHYLGWHGTSLLALAALLWSDRLSARARRLFGLAGSLLLVGTLIFSASLFVLVLTEVGAFGAITPIGGLLLIAGWGVLIAATLQLKHA